MQHRECAFCGIRCTFVTASGVAEDPEVRDSFCTESKYGTHKFRPD